MPYKKAFKKLQKQLLNSNNSLCLFLKTNNNIYSFRSALTSQEQLDIINPINKFLSDKDYYKYDTLERRPNTIYYISNEMEEHKSLNNILDLNKHIECNEVATATIKTVETDIIKLVIFKKDNFLFLYKYNSGKIFKQGWKAKFNAEEAVVEKDINGTLMLSKTIPDIILDTKENLAFILNITQAEYILQIESLFKSTLNNVSENLKKFNLMKKDTIESFTNKISSKNNYMRKLHKIQTTQSYQYFHNNITRIPEVISQYSLNVKFDSTNGQIIFNEETDVGDVLHLFADDYVKRYISERDDVIK